MTRKETYQGAGYQHGHEQKAQGGRNWSHSPVLRNHVGGHVLVSEGPENLLGGGERHRSQRQIALGCQIERLPLDPGGRIPCRLSTTFARSAFRMDWRTNTRPSPVRLAQSRQTARSRGSGPLQSTQDPISPAGNVNFS